MKKLAIASVLISLMTLVGCASSGPIEIGQGRYMISDQQSMTWSGGAVLQAQNLGAADCRTDRSD